MSEIYLKNYWLLNLEYIKVFSELVHHNISLPLLSNFYQYLEEDVKSKMKSKDFYKYLSVAPIEEKQLQSEFEKWLPLLEQMTKKRGPDGVVLLNTDYLRFSAGNFSHFNPEYTKILTRAKKSELYGLPTICTMDYTNKVPDSSHIFIEKAQKIFSTYKEHPLFSNKFFQTKLLNDLPIMIEKINMAYFIFEEHDISSVIVGTTEDITNRVLTLISKSKGIPSYCLQHGAIMGEEAFFPIFATKQIVYGEYEREWYFQRGGADSQIEILGHPRYDDIYNKKHLEKKVLCKKLNIDPSKKIIFIATQPFKTQVYVELTKQLMKDKNITVIIKPHPWEKGRNLVSEYIHLSKVYPNIKYITTEVNIYDVISNSDLVVISNSTVGLEAMLLDKPVVVYKSKSEERDYKYYDELSWLVTHSIENMIQTIEKVLYDSSYSTTAKQLRDYFIQKNYPQTTVTQKLQDLSRGM